MHQTNCPVVRTIIVPTWFDLKINYQAFLIKQFSSNNFSRLWKPVALLPKTWMKALQEYVNGKRRSRKGTELYYLMFQIWWERSGNLSPIQHTVAWGFQEVGTHPHKVPSNHTMQKSHPFKTKHFKSIRLLIIILIHTTALEDEQTEVKAICNNSRLAASQASIVILFYYINTSVLQGSHPFSETNLQDFSRTFPDLRLNFPGL